MAGGGRGHHVHVQQTYQPVHHWAARLQKLSGPSGEKEIPHVLAHWARMVRPMFDSPGGLFLQLQARILLVQKCPFGRFRELAVPLARDHPSVAASARVMAQTPQNHASKLRCTCEGKPDNVPQGSSKR